MARLPIPTLSFALAAAGVGLTSISAPLGAQPRPHFTGQLQLAPDSGTFGGELCVRAGAAPARRFVLNTGIVIDSVTTLAGERFPVAAVSARRYRNEGREYVIEDARADGGVCVWHHGRVPVAMTNDQVADWKGRITDWRGTMRFAEQTRWYPTPYDSAANVLHDVGTYSLDIRCAGCTGIYVNGAPPVRGVRGTFTSTVPRALLLYAGDVPITETADALFVGADVSSAASRVIQREITTIAEKYAQWMQVPYAEKPVFLSFTAVSRNYTPGQLQWLFVTWPTIAMSGGVSFDKLLDASASDRLNAGIRESLAHEMGHYYFGTVRWPSGPLQWFGLESTAEFLAQRELLEREGVAALATRSVVSLSEVLSLRPVALREVQEVGQIGESQRYRLLPLQLWQIHRRVGDAVMWAFLRGMLRSTGSFDLAAVMQAAAAAGIPRDVLEQWLLGPIDVSGDLKAAVLRDAHAALGSSGASQASAARLATALVNADSSASGRAMLRRFFASRIVRDSVDGLMLYQQGKLAAVSGEALAEGTAALRRYLTLTPGVDWPAPAEAWFRLGQIAARQGDVQGAREAFQEAVRRNPQHAGAKQALAALAGG